MSADLRTRGQKRSKSNWAVKLLVVVIFIVICAISYGLFTVYQKMNENKAAGDFILAQSLYEKGKLKEAETLLTRLYKDYPSLENRETVVYYLATIRSDSSLASSEPYWEAIATEYPDGTYAPKALLSLAKIAEASDDVTASTRIWTKLREEHPESEGAAYAELAEADEFARNGKTEAARQAYYKIIANSPMSPIVERAMDSLSAINTSILFSPAPNEWKKLVRVQRGDSLIKLAYNNKTSASMICRINGFGMDKNLIPGQQIYVPAIDSFKITVDKDDLHLYLYTGDGRFIKRYPVGIGRMDHLTPPGNYVVWHKLKQPPWYDREKGRKVMPDDPEYPLGTRWMTISPADNPDAYSRLGIHGTNEPDTIGHRASDGCVRMFNKDVEELYSIATKGTLVDIVQKGVAAASVVTDGPDTDDDSSSLGDWLDPEPKNVAE